MAVTKDKKDEASKGQDEHMLRFKGRQWIVGANVLVMVVLAAALLVFANYLAFTFNSKSDWTSTGINSLGEQSRKLMTSLPENVKLTSLYRTFQDPAFEAEAKKFRNAVQDILNLYQIESPSKVDVAFINPAKDRDKILALVDSLRKKTAYQGEAKKHRSLIETFNDRLSPEILALLEAEGKQLQAFADKERKLLDVRDYGIVMRNCQILAQKVDQAKQGVSAATADELPKYSGAVDEIKNRYEELKRVLTNQGEWLAKVDQWAKQYKIEDTTFFKEAPARYKKLIERIDAELDKAKDLPTLKLEELDRQVRPDTIIVETDEEARVLSFEDVWPAKQRGQFGQAMGNAFKDRRCAAEVEISSAVLQLTQKKRTGVVFARFGGQPLFFGGMMMMMGGGQAPYGGAKDRLEKANFVVKEWDLATKKEPPEFEDADKVDRVVWVLLKPDQVQPPQGMPPQMRRPPRQFGPEEREAVMKALGDEPRALFIAGWVSPPRTPMMMGPPPTYEYNDWLKDQWALEVRYSYPVLEAFSIEPGKMAFRRDPFSITRYRFSDQPIVAPLKGLKGMFPYAAPIKKNDKLPDGVTVTDLVTIPQRDDMWAESDFNGLVQEYQKKHHVTKGKMDQSGPFPIAVAATKVRDDKTVGKIVLVSSLRFAMDAVALSRALMQGAQGFMLVLNNPANMDLLVNAIHWLNDNEGLIGKGTESRDIPRLDELTPGVGLTVARALAVAVWPVMALLAGVAVWFVRRR